MAKSSSNDDNDNNNDDEEEDDDASFHKKGLMVLKALLKNKNACDNLYEIMSTLVERGILLRPQKQALNKRIRLKEI